MYIYQSHPPPLQTVVEFRDVIYSAKPMCGSNFNYFGKMINFLSLTKKK